MFRFLPATVRTPSGPLELPKITANCDAMSLLRGGMFVGALGSLFALVACSGSVDDDQEQAGNDAGGAPANEEQCGASGDPVLSVRVPQVVVDGACPLELAIVSEEDFEVLEELDCQTDKDDCLCALSEARVELDVSHRLLAREGEVVWGSVSSRASEGEDCSGWKGREFLETPEGFRDGAWLDSDVSAKKSLAFAAASRMGCASDDDCQAMPIGSKACGGPSGYIVYSTLSTDAEELEVLADTATDAEEQFNEDHEISSDCAYNEAPTLACEDAICVRVEQDE